MAEETTQEATETEAPTEQATEPEEKASEEQAQETAEQPEQKTEEATKHTPKPGSPRWEDIYRKMKGFERENDSLKSENMTMVERARQMDERVSKIETTQSTNEVEAELGAVDIKMQKAAEDNDMSLYHQLNNEKTKIIVKNLNDKQQPQAKQVSPQDDIELKVAQQMFYQKNDWYSSDSAMKAVADSFDANLSNHPDWKNRSYTERFNEVAKLTRERFNMNNTPTPTSPVEGITPSQPPQAKTAINLTDTEKSVAKKMFPMVDTQKAYEKYAKNRA